MFVTAGSRPGRRRPSKARIVLNQTAIYYVDSSAGNDAGPGTFSSPWKTRQKAWNYVQQNVDMNQQVVIAYCNGTFTETFTGQGVFVGDRGGAFNFIGLNNNAANFLCQSTANGATAFTFQNGAECSIQYCTIGSTGTAGIGVNIGNYCIINFYNCTWSACTTHGCEVNGNFIQQNAITISGDMPRFLNVESGGKASLTQQFIASGGTRNFTDTFINCNAGSVIETSGMPAPSGTFTGVRAKANTGGEINVDTATSLPGNAPMVNTGGYIVVNSVVDMVPRLFAALTADQSVTSSTWTKVTLTAQTDSHSWFASNVYTPLMPGTYFYSFSVVANATFTTDLENFAALCKNGAGNGTGAISDGYSIAVAGAPTDTTSFGSSGLVSMNGTTDTLELDAFIAGTTSKVRGNSNGFQTALTIFRVGP
jgi:hypothetical protein